MYNLQEKICLVIPCYNEAKRLDFNKFSNCGDNCFFLFVNDGSTDNTLELLKTNLKDNMFLLNLENNLGKGEAVRKGMLHVQALAIFDQIDWVGYWDADLACPLTELNNFILFKNTSYPKAEAVFGIRMVRPGSSITRSYKRKVISRVFNSLLGFTLGIFFYDSLCGAKLFRKDALNKYFKKPFISRWIFDVEILLRMGQKNIAQYLLTEWREVPGGSLKLSLIAIPVLRDVIKLRKKYC